MCALRRRCRDCAVAFRIYDINGDGFVSAEELYRVLKSIIGAAIDDNQLLEIAQRTVDEYDTDKDKQLSFDEFQQVTALHSTTLTLSSSCPRRTLKRS